jgi:hypothetical protein
MVKKQPEVVGTSSHLTQQEDMVQIPNSPWKKPAIEIVLPRIPEGLQVDSQLLGHIRKLEYFDHDIVDKTKYPEVAPQVFMQTIDVNPLGGTVT